MFPFIIIPLEKGQSPPKISLKKVLITLFLAACGGVLIICVFIGMIFHAIENDDYFHNHRITEKHILRNNLPHSTTKHLVYGREGFLGGGYEIKIICFDPADVESVKKKHSNKDSPWIEFSEACIDYGDRIRSADSLISQDLPLMFKTLQPSYRGWDDHMLYSPIGKLLDTQRGILWEFRW